MLSWIIATGALAVTPGPCKLPEGVRPAQPRPAWVYEAVSTTHPLRIHWIDPAAETRAMQALAAAELSWDIQVTQMGFRAPLLPDLADGEEFDIYMAPIGWGYAYVTADEWPYVDPVPGDGFNGASAYMVIDEGLSEAWIDSYIAHEFQHVSQYATDFSEWTLPIWESVATAAQEWTLGWPASDWDYDVNGFQAVPWAPTVLADQYELVGTFGAMRAYNFEYGGALWVMHLDRTYGTGDGALGVALWQNAAQEGYPNEPDALDAVAATAGTTVGGFLSTLARDRWLVGPEWDTRGLFEAQYWSEGDIPSHDTIATPALPATWTPSEPPMVVGQAFVDIDLEALDPAKDLRIVARSDGGALSGLTVLWWRTDGTAGDAVADGVNPEIRVPAGDLDRVVVAVSHAGHPSWDGDDDAYQEGDHVVDFDLSDPLPPPPPTTTPPGGTTAPPPTDPPTDPSDPTDPGTTPTNDGDSADPPSEDAGKGCKCDQSGTGSWGLWLGALALVRRRR